MWSNRLRSQNQLKVRLVNRQINGRKLKFAGMLEFMIIVPDNCGSGSRNNCNDRKTNRIMFIVAIESLWLS